MIKINFSKRRLVRWLSFLAASFAVISIFFQALKYFFDWKEIGIIEFFNIGSEQNLPTLFAVLLLLFTSVLLFIIFKLRFKDRKRFSFYWLVLSIIFIIIGLDEHFMLHERITEPLRDLLNLSGIFYPSWVIMGLLFIFILFFLYIRFLITLPGNIRLWFIIAGVIFASGAIILEMIGGWYFEISQLQSFTYQIFVTSEEILEMFGIIIFIRTLLDYLGLLLKESENTVYINIS